MAKNSTSAKSTTVRAHLPPLATLPHSPHTLTFLPSTVTWDTASPLFSPNTTLKLVANYHNATSTSGSIAFTSDPTSASWGYIAWPIQASYLASGTSSSNVTLYLTTQSGHQATGPTVQLLYPPGPSPPPQTQAPKGRDLYIALPAVAGFILVCVVGGFFWNRKQRTIGLGNVMGRKRGYGERKSRRQRLGLGGGRGKQAVALRVRELDGPGAYRDDVQAGSGRGKPEALDLDLGFDTPRKFAGHQRTDSEGLGSLVGKPTEERPRGNGNGNGNVFREEIRRQDVSRFST
jgi:hypothetical protein